MNRNWFTNVLRYVKKRWSWTKGVTVPVVAGPCVIGRPKPILQVRATIAPILQVRGRPVGRLQVRGRPECI